MAFPLARLRRARSTPAIREILREVRLQVQDLIYPIFVDESARTPIPIRSMPGQSRLRLSVAVLITMGLTLLVLRAAGVLALTIGVLTCLTILWASKRHFRGVTGDVFGAVNDLVWMTSLVTVLAVSP